jgi:hypothetical protein
MSTAGTTLNAAACTTFTTFKTEQLKLDLDEVEELTTRVRDTVPVDLTSNARRYSPLLYEYYRKQTELLQHIQCTYNIQCSSLFDAMTLMRKCLVDYSRTVHNPEYITANDLASSQDVSAVKQLSQQQSGDLADIKVNTFSDYLAKNGYLMVRGGGNGQPQYQFSNSKSDSPITGTTTASAVVLNEQKPPIDFFSASSSSTDPSTSTSTSSLSSNNPSLLLNPSTNLECLLGNGNRGMDIRKCVGSIMGNNQTYV